MNNCLKEKNLQLKIPVNNNIIPWDLSILQDSTINKFFNKADIDVFKTEMQGLKKDVWNYTFTDAILIKNIPYSSTPSATIFSYSMPLFSFDKKRVLVIEGFYCGVACGGGAYYIYKQQTNGNWLIIKKFKEWSE